MKYTFPVFISFNKGDKQLNISLVIQHFSCAGRGHETVVGKGLRRGWW